MPLLECYKCFHGNAVHKVTLRSALKRIKLNIREASDEKRRLWTNKRPKDPLRSLSTLALMPSSVLVEHRY